MKIDDAYNTFKIGARNLNLQSAAEVKTVINQTVGMYNIMLRFAVPATFVLGLIFLPFFGMGIIFLIMSLIIFLAVRKKPKMYREIGERYIAEMGLA